MSSRERTCPVNDANQSHTTERTPESDFLFIDALRFLKDRYQQQSIRNLQSLFVVSHLAREKGLTVSEAELQSAADDFRRLQGLESASATLEYLQVNNLTIRDFEFLLEHQILFEKLKQALCTADAVQETFARNVELFEVVELRALEFESDEDAEEFFQALVSGTVDFPDSPSREDNCVPKGARMVEVGLATRSDLAPEVASRVFIEEDREFIGPVKSAGKSWIYQIVIPRQAQINDTIYTICEDLLMLDLISGSFPEH